MLFSIAYMCNYRDIWLVANALEQVYCVSVIRVVHVHRKVLASPLQMLVDQCACAPYRFNVHFKDTLFSDLRNFKSLNG